MGERMERKSSLKWIIKGAGKENKKMIVLLVANALFSVLSIVFALLMKEVIDSATTSNTKRLFSYGVAIVLIVVLQFGFRVFINCLAEHIQARLEINYKTRLFGAVLNKKQSKISAYHSGELMTRLTSDVAVVSEGVATILPTVVSAVARLVSAIFALIVLDWIFAVAFCIAGMLVFMVITLLRGKLKKFHKDTQQTDGKVRSFMQECIENLLAVKVFSANERVEKHSSDLQERNYKIKMKRRNYSVLGHATYNLIFSAGFLFALLYGGVKLLRGAFTYGSLTAILQLVNNVQVPFASLSNVVPKYYSMIASAERIMEIENIESEPKLADLDVAQIYAKMNGLLIDNVEFAYDRESVLKNASTYIKKGEFVVVTGRSGAGKSTLVKLLLGVYETKSGEICLDLGEDRLKLNEATRQLFSYVPQGNMLFSGTIRDNVTFINSGADEQQINKALELSQAKEFVSLLPQGLDTVVGENGVGLSEGQIQRIALARALLSKAPILILDEATSALDEQTEKAVLNNLKSLDGVTIIMISHKKTTLSVCDRNIQIKDKRIKEIA